ncbi:hypothetical protein CYY_009932 [Polysphondylium violaceum]|uniref:MACPF domain-containing protein n=1 Tax=Polysphondylium violaceum TaxID=133409 RepID=A0A8J4UUY9_9MYCE|nr:hypothetical protein CYY_009932 [Polysphondylium violaceum]
MYSSSYGCNSVSKKIRNDLSCKNSHVQFDKLTNIKDAGFSCEKSKITNTTTFSSKSSLCNIPAKLCKTTNTTGGDGSTSPTNAPTNPSIPGGDFKIGDGVCNSLYENCLNSPQDCNQCYFSGGVLTLFTFGSNSSFTKEKYTEITNFYIKQLPQGEALKGSFFAYLSVKVNGEYSLNIQGTNIGARIFINLMPIFDAMYQQSTITANETVYLQSGDIHTISGDFFSFMNLPTNFKIEMWDPKMNQIKPFFYSKNTCGDGILDIDEICPSDQDRIKLDARTGGCNSTDPNEDFLNCYSKLTKVCPSRQVPPRHISPGFSYSRDTLGNLISNQFIWHLPGSEHFSFGINIINGLEASSPIFYFAYCDSIGTNLMEDVYRGRVYDIPKEFYGKALPECKYSTSSKQHTKIEEMSSSMHTASTQAYGASVGGGIPVVSAEAKVAFTEEKSVEKSQSIMTQEKNYLIETTLVCSTSILRLTDAYTFHPIFLESIAKVQDIEDMLLLVHNSLSGSKFESIQKKSSRTTISTYGGALGAFGPTEYSSSTSNFASWASTVDLLPVPVEYDLKAIRDIIPPQWTISNGKNVQELWICGAEELFCEAAGVVSPHGPRLWDLYEFQDNVEKIRNLIAFKSRTIEEKSNFEYRSRLRNIGTMQSPFFAHFKGPNFFDSSLAPQETIEGLDRSFLTEPIIIIDWKKKTTLAPELLNTTRMAPFRCGIEKTFYTGTDSIRTSVGYWANEVDPYSYTFDYYNWRLWRELDEDANVASLSISIDLYLGYLYNFKWVLEFNQKAGDWWKGTVVGSANIPVTRDNHFTKEWYIPTSPKLNVEDKNYYTFHNYRTNYALFD